MGAVKVVPNAIASHDDDVALFKLMINAIGFGWQFGVVTHLERTVEVVLLGGSLEHHSTVAVQRLEDHVSRVT